MRLFHKWGVGKRVVLPLLAQSPNSLLPTPQAHSLAMFEEDFEYKAFPHTLLKNRIKGERGKKKKKRNYANNPQARSLYLSGKGLQGSTMQCARKMTDVDVVTLRNTPMQHG